MSGVSFRDYQSADLDSLIDLWNQSIQGGFQPVYSLSEVVASCQKDAAVVAVSPENQVIGIAVARAAHDQGWVVFFATDSRHRRQGIGEKLLSSIEQKFAHSGLARLSLLVPEDQHKIGVITKAGFSEKKHLKYFEREIPVRGPEIDALKKLNGRLLSRDLWVNIAGMKTEKEILENRLVLPLSNQTLADKYAVVPPKSIVLFGPPGTGKTTFARAIASRLEWPFVEVFPSRLAALSDGLAAGLRETFENIAQLNHAVVFIDEVEEIAGQRGGEPPSANQGVTNELLKLIPDFREHPNKLLICATNFIRAIDDAFLRHGRFDYVIPIGLPDSEARQAIWSKLIPEKTFRKSEIEVLVSKSQGFSPADIEYAARRASQLGFERAIREPNGTATGPTMMEYLESVEQTKTTVSPTVAESFSEDIQNLART